MKVTMEMEPRELLECGVCGEPFNGTAVLRIDLDGECVDEVFCTPCNVRGLPTTTIKGGNV